MVEFYYSRGCLHVTAKSTARNETLWEEMDVTSLVINLENKSKKVQLSLCCN